MSFSNNLMAEIMVPRDVEAAERLKGFYNELGWNVWHDSGEPEFIYTSPLRAGPVVGYWQTDNPEKIAKFGTNPADKPSRFAKELRLAQLHNLIEICLVVSTNDEVAMLYEQGGQLLLDHTHTPIRQHAGATEFRFADPFNFSLRVTADPGYQIQPND